MTTKIVLLTSSFDWESVRLDRFDDLLSLKNGTGELVKRAQEEKLSREIKKIQKKKEVKKNSHFLSLSPILGKDGLLRVGGRIDRAPVPYENRHPIIIPAKRLLTRKIIRIYHCHLKYCGTDYAIAHLRQQFWVINGREEVKRIGRECPECRRERAIPAGQLIGYLPDVRLDMLTPPFDRTAVDFFGPLQVNLGRNQEISRVTISDGRAAADLAVRSQRTPQWQTSWLRKFGSERPKTADSKRLPESAIDIQQPTRRSPRRAASR